MLKTRKGIVKRNSGGEVAEKTPTLWISNIIFVSLVHLVAVVAIILYRPHFMTLLMCFFLWHLSVLGVTMGYHRLWSHKTYEGSLFLKIILAFLGTIAFQGSIKWWAFRHRLHHRFVDSDNDPHSALKGLWYSHIGWIFEKRTYAKAKLIDMHDLESDSVVQFQHRFFIPLALIGGFGVPVLLSWLLWDDLWGGLLYGGFVARIVIWHSIFSINSLAHYVGTQEYSLKNTSRGNLFLAFLTNGEGHHNFHHEFPSDYRNGIHFLDYDPTKWAIYLASLLGLAKNLKRSSEKSILEARLAVIEELIRADAESHAVEEPTSYPTMTAAQMKRKIKAGGVLFIVDGYVVDVKSYVQDHPGGAEVLYSFVGTDVTDAFRGGVNTHSTHAERLLKNFRIAKFENN